MEDVIVTLLDGTKVKKSQVPIGEIYINEKGQKVRKVQKMVQVVKKSDDKKGKTVESLSPKLNSNFGKAREGIASAITQGSSQVSEGATQLLHVAKNSFDKIGEQKQRAKKSAYAFMNTILARLMNKINIGKTIQTLEEYQKTSGKDISNLIDFLKKLQTIR